MDLFFSTELAKEYKSNTQIARVLSESWVKSNSFCPYCGHDFLNQYENNKPVADFFCPACGRIFELKSQREKISGIINDGAYRTMIERILSNENPDFFFLSYSKEHHSVNNYFVVPKHFFVPEIIIKRKPLSENARRANWIGCKINLNAIPAEGRIYIVKDQTEISKEQVLHQFSKTAFLGESSVESRGWIMDVMRCIDRIANAEFTLNEVYRFEDELQLLHADNHNIRAKIRQQLQKLRDVEYIDFLGNGRYRKRSV